MSTNSYATDGKCHNAEPGMFNHECGKPAEWLGTTKTGFESGFCDCCKRKGWEARGILSWRPVRKQAWSELAGKPRTDTIDLEELLAQPAA